MWSHLYIPFSLPWVPVMGNLVCLLVYILWLLRQRTRMLWKEKTKNKKVVLCLWDRGHTYELVFVCWIFVSLTRALYLSFLSPGSNHVCGFGSKLHILAKKIKIFYEIWINWSNIKIMFESVMLKINYNFYKYIFIK